MLSNNLLGGKCCQLVPLLAWEVMSSLPIQLVPLLAWEVMSALPIQPFTAGPSHCKHIKWE